MGDLENPKVEIPKVENPRVRFMESGTMSRILREPDTRRRQWSLAEVTMRSNTVPSDTMPTLPVTPKGADVVWRREDKETPTGAGNMAWQSDESGKSPIPGVVSREPLRVRGIEPGTSPEVDSLDERLGSLAP